MSSATERRHKGNMPRTHSTRLFALIDGDLAKPSGLEGKRFCRENDVSAMTLTNYLSDLTMLGIRLAYTDGVWRYEEAQTRLFSDRGFLLFQRA
jgi:hypothetical protein